MATEIQLITRYQKERMTLIAQRDALTRRIEHLDTVLTGLHGLTGKGPAPRRTRSSRSGTKATIIDVLADGKSRSLREVASAAKVSIVNVAHHMTELVKSGDVTRTGQSRATRYEIP